MHLLYLGLLGLGPGLTASLPSPGYSPFITEVRNHTFDWNAPHPDYANFLAKRSDMHSEDYFNNPPPLKVRSTSEDVTLTPLNPFQSRATSGQWENMGGTGQYHPYPISWGGKRMDVYHYHRDRRCRKRWKDNGGGWSGWEDLGGTLDSAPHVCYRRPNNHHVFCKGTDNQCWHRPYDNGNWGSWQALGGSMRYYPCSCSYAVYHITIIVIAIDGGCWHRKYDDRSGGWGSWESMGGFITAPPKVVTWGEGHLAVIVKGDDGQAWVRQDMGSGWGSWQSLGGSLDSEAGAVAWNNQIEFFVKGTDGACWRRGYQRSTNSWGSWENMGGKLKPGTAPDVVIYNNIIELYITGDDGAVYRKKKQNGAWTSSWENMGGNVDTKPAAVTWDDGQVDVYGTGSDGSCRRCF